MTASQSTVDRTRGATARGPIVHHNLSVPVLYEAAIQRDEGVIAAGGPFVVRTGHAHRPLAEGQVRRRRAGQPRQGLVGRGQQAHQRGALRAAAREGPRPSRGARDVRQGCLRGRRPVPPALGARDDRDGLGQPLRPQPLHPSLGGRAGGLPARLHDLRRTEPAGRSGHRRHALGHVHPRPRHASRGAHRRHRVRRRDQEERLHGDELPAPRRGRAAHALVGQRRAGRRSDDLLRPLRHGQDDARGRPHAHAHRRRRARLGPGRRLQLRGRLLRQDDPPLAHLRAGHLLHHEALRDHPGERGHGSRHAGSSTSTPRRSPRTRAPRSPSRSSPTPSSRASPATRAR